MAAGARIRNLVLVRHYRRDEVERVTTNIDVGNGLFNPGHVAGYAITGWTVGAMVRMRLDTRSVRPIR